MISEKRASEILEKSNNGLKRNGDPADQSNWKWNWEVVEDRKGWRTRRPLKPTVRRDGIKVVDTLAFFRILYANHYSLKGISTNSKA